MILACFILNVAITVLAAPGKFDVSANQRRSTPSGSYAPTIVPCPSEALVRNASSLSTDEEAYLLARKEVTRPILHQFLSTTGLTDLDTLFDLDLVPNLGLAFSGGGYRAMIDGGGRLNALDWRNPQSNGTGQLGGLFQAANYIAGLSGGAWLVGGLAMNGNPKIFDQWHKVWNLGESVVNPGGIDILQTGSYYMDILSEVHGKQTAGFAVTITDVWGRALSRHLIDSTIYGNQGGPSATWTDMARQQAFINHTMPFSIVIADQRSPGASAIATNTSNYEFNAFEFGSFDASVFAFTPMKYLGSNLQNGVPIDDDRCVAGFDSASFVLATSSSLFNGAMTVLNNTVATSDLLTYVLSELSNDQFDIASYPNPFFGIPGIQGSEASDLTLVDGGMDGQNIALNPLLQPIRHLDVIIASDSSADTDNHWPNGTALVTAYDRYTSEQGNGTSFVYVPDAQTFVNLGLNTRPTFFGCNRSNITAGINVAPLIVYLPMHQYHPSPTFQHFCSSTLKLK